jgi:hypothetical protein
MIYSLAQMEWPKRLLLDMPEIGYDQTWQEGDDLRYQCKYIVI